MISLEQVQALEQKVSKAIELLNRLRDENAKLRAKLKSTQTKTAELETVVTGYKQEQEAVEKGILSVLSKLDKLEDEVSLSKKDAPKSPETVLAPGVEGEKEAKKSWDKAKPAGNKDELDIF